MFSRLISEMIITKTIELRILDVVQEELSDWPSMQVSNLDFDYRGEGVKRSDDIIIQLAPCGLSAYNELTKYLVMSHFDPTPDGEWLKCVEINQEDNPPHILKIFIDGKP